MNNEIGIQVIGAVSEGFELALTPEALEFVADLHREFNPTREALLKKRVERQAEFDAGALPEFRSDTQEMRSGDWKVAATPDDLQQRWAEITGPVERKMMINALNSGADGFMADFEDSLAPHWENVVNGQINLIDAVRRRIEFTNPAGRVYKLNEETATLLVRPRGWHLVEKHVLVDGQPISASIFDFGLYFFHNAAELLKRGSGPYYYLAKLENHIEARLWNDVFNKAQDDLSIPRGSIRATVLIETILAAFEMEEILYELREHGVSLNAGRWDYIFSIIKKFSSRPEFVLPERVQVTMTVPFMRAYTELLVSTCHQRGAHAIGGMAAFIPSRRDEQVNKVALAKVREDKERESTDGFDGTWVAHPDLVPLAREIFEEKLGDKLNQKDRLREDVKVSAEDLLSFPKTGGNITEAGLRNNISVATQYLSVWMQGYGAVAINNLMEDVATAEIARAQLWQWIRCEAKLDDGRTITSDLYKQIRKEELEKLGGADKDRLGDAAEIMDKLVLSDTFTDFLTHLAYDKLD